MNLTNLVKRNSELENQMAKLIQICQQVEVCNRNICHSFEEPGSGDPFGGGLVLSECSSAIWSEGLNDNFKKSHSFRMLVPRKVADSYCLKNNNKWWWWVGETSVPGAIPSPFPVAGGVRIQHEVCFFLHQTEHPSYLKRLLGSKGSWEPQVLRVE